MLDRKASRASKEYVLVSIREPSCVKAAKSPLPAFAISWAIKCFRDGIDG